MTICFSCGTSLPDTLPFHRSDSCEHCGADVRVCRNCRFYDPGAQWQCREHISEPVSDKTRANFCDYFQARRDGNSGGTGATDSSSARTQFDKLFGE